MVARNGTGLRRVGLAAVLALGLPVLAACDDSANNGEGVGDRAGKALDNAASKAADSAGKALERAGNAIQRESQEAQNPEGRPTQQ
jgi:hypothetical protein